MPKKTLVAGADATCYTLGGQVSHPTLLCPANFDVQYAAIFHPEDGKVPYWEKAGLYYRPYDTSTIPSVTEQIERFKATFGLADKTNAILEREGTYDQAHKDGTFAVPFPQDLGVDRCLSLAGYGTLTEKVVDTLGRVRPVINKRAGNLAGRVLLTDETWGRWARYAQMLPAASGTVRFLVVPGNMGSMFTGHGATIARAKARTNSWMVPGPAEVGTILIAWPERLAQTAPEGSFKREEEPNALDCVGAVYETRQFRRAEGSELDARDYPGSLYYNNPHEVGGPIYFHTCNGSAVSPSNGCAAPVLFT